jgi:hypothetical protein
MPPYHGVWANGRPCRPVCSATRPAVCSATAGPDRTIERAPRCMRRSGSPEWITAVDRFGVCAAVERPGVCAAVCAPRWRPAVCAPRCVRRGVCVGIGESKSLLLQVMVKSLYYKFFCKITFTTSYGTTHSYGLEEIQISICGKYMFYYSKFRDYCVFSTPR